MIDFSLDSPLGCMKHKENLVKVVHPVDNLLGFADW